MEHCCGIQAYCCIYIVVLSPEKVVFQVLSLFYLFKFFIFKLFYIFKLFLLLGDLFVCIINSDIH